MSHATCRCPMCGEKNAGQAIERRGYARVNIGCDEHGRDWNGLSKRQTRKLRRSRERHVFRNEER